MQVKSDRLSGRERDPDVELAKISEVEVVVERQVQRLMEKGTVVHIMIE